MNNNVEVIPESEKIFFKEKVQRWINIDEQISGLEKQIKDLKKIRNKELEPNITEFMNKYNIRDLNTESVKLRCQEHKTKKCLNKDNIKQNLSKYLTETDTLNEAVDKIINDREIVIKYKIKKVK